MANEWTVVELYGMNNDGAPRRYTIADGTAVSKGTLLALSTPRTATVSAGTSTAFAGVAAEEHKPNIGVTSISAWTDGVFSAVASFAIVAGGPISGCESNKVISGAVVAADLKGGAGLIGYAFDTFANGDTKTVRLYL